MTARSVHYIEKLLQEGLLIEGVDCIGIVFEVCAYVFLFLSERNPVTDLDKNISVLFFKSF